MGMPDRPGCACCRQGDKPVERLQWITQSGKDILIMDLSACAIDEAMRVIARAEPLIRTRPPLSLLILTDVTGSRYNAEWANKVKVFARDNGPFVRASAVVGVKGMGQILISAIETFSGRAIQSFDDRAEAIAWLATQ